MTMNFFKRFDRFPKGVSLTYKQAGSLPTSIGGLFSILMYTYFLFWVITEYLDVYRGTGKFIITNNAELTQQPDGSFPQYEITEDQMFFAYNFTDISANKTLGDLN